MKCLPKIAGLLALAALVVPAANAVHPGTAAAPDDEAAVIRAQLPSYPLEVCPISGEKLGSMGDPINFVHEGRLVRLCCGGCKKGVAADAEKVVAKINAAVIAQQKASYPLRACPISGKEFTKEAPGVDHVHGTRLVRTCCEKCAAAIDKSPDKTMAMLDAAYIKAQVATYPFEKCLVSDEPLTAMGEPYDLLYGTTLVRLCCKSCRKEFDKEPAQFVAKVKKARAAASAAKSPQK